MKSTEPLQLYNQHRPTFDRLSDLLLKWNQKINLTAITDPSAISELHFMDSLFALEAIVSRETMGRSLTVLDMGAGAGFPGLPLKIVHPTLQLTLVDSVKKKCDFMKEAVRQLDLKGVVVLNERSETAVSIVGAPFDRVISRAAFKLKELVELASPNLKSGGLLIAMKGLEIEEEVQDSSKVLKSLGYGPWTEVHYQLPISQKVRSLLMAYRT